MERPHDLCQKVFTYTGNREIAIRAVRECFGLNPLQADQVMNEVELNISPPGPDAVRTERTSLTRAGRIGVWLIQGLFGIFSGVVTFIVLGCTFPKLGDTLALVLFFMIIASSLSGGATTAMIDGVRPGSIGKWMFGVVLVSVGCFVLSLGCFSAVASVYRVLRSFKILEPPPESSDITGVLETFALVTLCVAAAAPLSGELALMLSLLRRRDTTVV